MIFETHAHYDDKAFDEDRESLIAGLMSEGVDSVINCGADMASSKRSLELSRRYTFIHAAVGVHPDEIGELFGLTASSGAGEEGHAETDTDIDPSESSIAELEQMVTDLNTVAVGEIGLDYHWDIWPRELQRRAFTMQWELAVKHNRPIIIHSRDAAEDTMTIIREMYQREKTAGRELRADLHCYSYSADQAREYIGMGLMFGIGGVLTFKNARKLREVAELLPLDRILLETDCPYMAPEPFRGSRNNSAYIKYVAEKLAEIKGTEVEEIYRVTHLNAERFFAVRS